MDNALSLQRSWQRLSAGLLHFRMSFSLHWMHRKKALGSLHCDNAESQSSTCPMRSVSNIGILKTLSWPSASSTSASFCCRTIRCLDYPREWHFKVNSSKWNYLDLHRVPQRWHRLYSWGSCSSLDVFVVQKPCIRRIKTISKANSF